MHNVKVTYGPATELEPLPYDLDDSMESKESWHRTGRKVRPNDDMTIWQAVVEVGPMITLATLVIAVAYYAVVAVLRATNYLVPVLLLAVFCLPVSAAGDYNFNGMIDCQDCEILQFATRVWTDAFIGGDPDPEGAAESAVLSEYGYSHLFDDFDLTGDGILLWDVMQNPSITSDADRLILLEANTFYGDANLDGRVSLIDLDILGQNFGQPGGWCEGDFNGDGQVSLIDLDILGRFYGSGM